MTAEQNKDGGESVNRILVIDDDRELCALIRRSVLPEEIEADCCYAGRTGLEKLKEKEYQLPDPSLYEV